MKNSELVVTLETPNQPQVESCVSLEIEQLFPITWMCKKQTAVSHSSTESEITSLAAGLRMDGHQLSISETSCFLTPDLITRFTTKPGGA